MEHNGAQHNGTADIRVEDCTFTEHGSLSGEMQAIVAGYAQINRRDGGLERLLWRRDVSVYALIALLVLFAGILIWLVMQYRNVQAFVQLVQVSDEGKIQPLGLPQRLLDYTPAEGEWLSLLSQWITHARWRGTDGTRAQADKEWLELHTCKQAWETLATYDTQEQQARAERPHEQPTLVTVRLESIAQSTTPGSYTVLWEEIIAGKRQPERWGGILTVGRIKPASEAAMWANPLGQCITAFALTRRS